MLSAWPHHPFRISSTTGLMNTKSKQVLSLTAREDEARSL